MKNALPYLTAIALVIPWSGAAAQSGGWWGSVSDRVPTRNDREPAVCRVQPNLPVCDVVGDRRGRNDDSRYESGSKRNGRRGNGPPFCRNGQGHPTKGREWCREKGWSNDRWYDVGWDDVILGRPRTRRSTLDRGGLSDVLGDIILGRLQRQAGADAGRLTGRLLGTDTRILQIRAGSRPLAELLDANGDGRADRVLLYRR